MCIKFFILLFVFVLHLLRLQKYYKYLEYTRIFEKKSNLFAVSWQKPYYWHKCATILSGENCTCHPLPANYLPNTATKRQRNENGSTEHTANFLLLQAHSMSRSSFVCSPHRRFSVSQSALSVRIGYLRPSLFM